MSTRYDEYLLTPEWKAKRQLVVDRAGGRCERCLKQGQLEVHHVTYDRLGAERLDDLEALCPECHKQADAERVRATRKRKWGRRLDGWARKKYGDEWQDRWDAHLIADEFCEWLERVER